MHEESCSDILYFLKVGVTSKHVAILSMSLKGVSAADESTSLQTLCACNRVFLYIFTCLDVLCSCSILLLSWASFQTRVLILPWASFQTRVLKIWKKVKKHIRHLLILVQIKYRKELLQNPTAGFV